MCLAMKQKDSQIQRTSGHHWGQGGGRGEIGVGHSVSSAQSLSCVRLIATPWTAAHQASLSITNFWSLLKLMSIESVMPSNHLILCRPLLHKCVLCAKSLQSCPTLHAMDCSPPGSSAHGILQARILKGVAISFSGRSS